METIETVPALEKMRSELSYFTVGFAKFTRHSGKDDAQSAGSGTLVSLGQSFGILTAAHVLKNLPDEGQVGLVRYSSRPEFAEQMKLEMSYSEKLIIAADVFGPDGPDIGFLKLPQQSIGTLQARNVFFNLGIRSESVLNGNEPEPPSLTAFPG